MSKVTAKAYLTIDDSPSMRMDDMIDALNQRKVPALFFCRGDALEQNMTAAIRAVEHGFLLGNHAYSHTRASEVTAEVMIEEIKKTEALIDNAYNMANADKPGQYFRFPHLDRGCGSWIMDFEKFDMKQRTLVKSIFTEGLNVISAAQPSEDDLKKMATLQAYLKEAGYTAPFSKVKIDWYENPQISAAHDCLFTFSTADWMVTERHRGKWRYKSVEDLKNKIFHDHWLLKDDNCSIILAHDQAEILDITLELVDYMLDCGLTFVDFDA